jgi:isopentenyldiphosphate isomerase
MIHSSGFYRHIQACNRHHPEDFVPFFVAGQALGRLRPRWRELLLRQSQVFLPQGPGLALHPDLRDYAQRSAAVAEVLEWLVHEGLHEYLLHEPYPVTPAGPDQALLEIDRSAAALFGLRSFGQHLNGYVRDGDEWLMWIGRRAADRRLYPGRLDQLVAGGLPAGVDLRQNLLKECHEEAGMAENLAAQARSVGLLSYNTDTKKGYKYDLLYCYDLRLPIEFTPVCTDAEVESFQLLPLPEVAERVRTTDDFKPNCALVIIDFLLRHGWIGPDHPEYLALNLGLRPAMSPLPGD